MMLNLYCWRLVLYSFDLNTDRGLRMRISKTLSHDLDHHDRHGHRDRVLSLRAKLRTRARQDRCVERDELAWCRARRAPRRDDRRTFA